MISREAYLKTQSVAQELETRYLTISLAPPRTERALVKEDKVDHRQEVVLEERDLETETNKIFLSQMEGKRQMMVIWRRVDLLFQILIVHSTLKQAVEKFFTQEQEVVRSKLMDLQTNL